METLCGFIAGVLFGYVIWHQPERAPELEDTGHYQPTILEHEVAGLLEPQELEIGAFLVEQEGLVGLALRDQRPS